MQVTIGKAADPMIYSISLTKVRLLPSTLGPMNKCLLG
jgi:hypothetical protein